MGCALSGPGVNHGGRTAPEANESGVESGSGGGTGTGAWLKSEQLSLSEAQKGLIRESWKILNEDIARVGIIMFIRLFETHPECKDVFFIFRDIDDLQELKMSKKLQAHGLRYEKRRALSYRFEDKLEQIAFELGRSHCRYSAPPKYYEYVGVQFISAVKPIVKENWTQEVEDSWKYVGVQFISAVKPIVKENWTQEVEDSWKGGMCSVFLQGTDKVVSISSEHLEPLTPTKNDKVKVILGEDREATGILLSIDGEDGIVRMELDELLKILNLRFLGKLEV
ncbi:UNVERIFIED_CONTAM: hypothetical protein FKN15_061195 [Acipenser sinensis]